MVRQAPYLFREKKPPVMVATEEMSVQDLIISYYHKRIHSYFSFYARISNYVVFQEMVKRELRNMCFEQLAQVERKSINEVKKIYGVKLEKHPWYISERKLNKTFHIFRAHYLKDERKFLNQYPSTNFEPRESL